MSNEVKLSTVGMNCPKPLIETRKALRKLKKGQILVVEGNHAISLKEIPKAMEDTGEEVIESKSMGDRWIIRIRKG